MKNARITAATMVVAVLAALGALLGAGAASAAPTPAPAPPKPQFFQNSGCGAIEAILVPGTTETTPTANPLEARGEMGKLGLDLQRKRPGTNVWMTPYQAQVGPFAGTTPLNDSVGGGVSRATQQIQQRAKACPNSKLVIGGYSQGALVASGLCQSIGNGKMAGVSAKQVQSCEFIGNPARAAGGKQTIGGMPLEGVGALGNGRDYGELQSVAYETCLRGDTFCDFRNQAVAAGLSGGQSPVTQIQTLPKLSWAGQGGAVQNVADVLASVAPLAFGGDNPHVRYSIGGANSPISQVGTRVASGRQMPSASTSTTSAPTGLQIPGLTTGTQQQTSKALNPSLQQFNGTGAGQAFGTIFGLTPPKTP